jgi:hypothetical protein
MKQFYSVLRSRIIFMRFRLWAKILMRLRRLLLYPLAYYIAGQNLKGIEVNKWSDSLLSSDSVQGKLL